MLKDLCFEIIQTCPNQCEFCSSNSSRSAKHIISLDMFKKTIDHFEKQGGIEEVSISGGEPFLHPNLMEMVKYCKDKNIRTVIFTSGIKRAIPLTQEEKENLEKECQEHIAEVELQEPWNKRTKGNIRKFYNQFLNPSEFSSISSKEMQQLSDLGLDKIVFDMQTSEEETYNQLMGTRGLITKVITSMLVAQNIGLNIDVHFIPMKANYKQFPDLLECLETARINRISILKFVPQGRGRIYKQDLMLTNNELQEFAQIYEEAKQKFKGRIRIGIPLLGNISHLCTAGTEKLDIRYDGEVLPCPAFKEISSETMQKYGINFGNIYTRLEEIAVTGGKREYPLCREIYGYTDEGIREH